MRSADNGGNGEHETDVAGTVVEAKVQEGKTEVLLRLARKIVMGGFCDQPRIPISRKQLCPTKIGSCRCETLTACMRARAIAFQMSHGPAFAGSMESTALTPRMIRIGACACC